MERRNKLLYVFLILCISFVSTFIYGKEKQDAYLVTDKKGEVFFNKSDLNILQQIEVLQEDDLLSEFKAFNIGNNVNKGIATIENSIIEILAIGSDFGGNKDEGYFLFKQLKGDFEVSFRIHSLSLVDLYTKAGIMARTDLSDNSKNVYFYVYPDNQERNNNNNNGGCAFQYRQKRGDETQAIFPIQSSTENNFNVNFPETWIKIKREGDSFTSYISKDNVNWHPYTTYKQKMPRILLVGLAVTSSSSNGFTRAQFSELNIKTFK